MMNPPVILTEIQNGICLMRLNRPQALNALNTATFDEMNRILETLEGMEGLRCIVITGEGKAFAAGADISEMQSMGPDEALRFSAYGQQTFQQLEDFPVPVIAAINGYALGGGLELALSCDIRLASEKARMGQPEVNLGLIPGFGGSQRLCYLVSGSDALFLLATGESISAAEALQMRLVTRVYSHESLVPEALQMAGIIASKGPQSVREVKHVVKERKNAFYGGGFITEQESFSRLFEPGSEGHEGMDAFLGKRTPAWQTLSGKS